MSEAFKLSVLGQRTERPDQPDASILEVIPNFWPEADLEVEVAFEEFTTLCPVTGRPDFGTIRVTYVPSSRLIEAKSLSFYLGAYRNHGCFFEHAVHTIADDLGEKLQPKTLSVHGSFRSRGGVSLSVTARYRSRGQR